MRTRLSIVALAILFAFGILVAELIIQQPAETTVAAPASSATCNTYSSQGSAITIPDANENGITSTIIIAPVNGKVASVQLAMNLTHDYKSDLTANLTCSNLCDSLIFDQNVEDYSSDPVTLHFANDGVPPTDGYYEAPFETVYQPMVDISSNFRPGGRWQLHIVDDAGGDEGTLNNWSLTVCTESVLTGTPVPTETDTPTVTPTQPTPTSIPAGQCVVFGTNGTCPSLISAYLGTTTPVPGSQMGGGSITISGQTLGQQPWLDQLWSCTLGPYAYTSRFTWHAYTHNSAAETWFGTEFVQPIGSYNGIQRGRCADIAVKPEYVSPPGLPAVTPSILYPGTVTSESVLAFESYWGGAPFGWINSVEFQTTCDADVTFSTRNTLSNYYSWPGNTQAYVYPSYYVAGSPDGWHPQYSTWEGHWDITECHSVVTPYVDQTPTPTPRFTPVCGTPNAPGGWGIF